jgi:hypothetical protein
MEMRLRLVTGTVALPALLIVLGLAGPAHGAPAPCSSGVGQDASGPCKKAKRAAANKAGERYGFDQPARQWSTACYPESNRRFQCTVHSGGTPPRCTGGVRVVKRDGRWRATKVELACRPG